MPIIILGGKYVWTEEECCTLQRGCHAFLMILREVPVSVDQTTHCCHPYPPPPAPMPQNCASEMKLKEYARRQNLSRFAVCSLNSMDLVSPHLSFHHIYIACPHLSYHQLYIIISIL